jgi:GMP synthase-like glutamine amidotransferase
MWGKKMSEVFIFKHVPFEGPGTLEDALKKRGIPYGEVNLFAEAAPKNLDGCGGLIIMGGPMNVYEEEEYPFLKEEDGLIKEALSRNLPMIGVCLGAQLMAKAAGARVTKGAKKEIGWYPLHLTDGAKSDPVFKALPNQLEVFQWHGDTFDIPKGAVKFASSELFRDQAFRIGTNAYAFQFHIEVTEEIIREWVDINEKELEGVKDYIDPVKILSESRYKASDLGKLAETIYKGLFNIFE